MQTEPKYANHTASWGDGLSVSFRGENWGDGLQDTAVKIGDALLCWIEWKDKEAFIKGLTEVVEKYRI